MKSLLYVLLTWGVIAFSSGAIVNAAEKEPAAKESKPAKTSSTARPIPFRGKVDKVDLEAKTVTVGKRVFHLTAKTKIMKDGHVAKLTDAELGEKVGGSYLKEPADKLVAVSIRFGEKPVTESKAKKTKEKKESE